MSEKVCVYGLWHLGVVVAGCLAASGVSVCGIDPDADRVQRLAEGQPPVFEPGLEQLIRQELASGRLSFSSDAGRALAEASVLFVCVDTPVDEADQVDAAWLRAQLEGVRGFLQPGTLVLISSQVPVGFTAQLEADWRQGNPSLQFAYSPENLRLGIAVETFRKPGRVVIGAGEDVDGSRVTALFAPFCDRFEWMSLHAAEMTKHAINSFLATSIAFANELARLCERVGADYREVERGLRSEPRIGNRLPLAAGPPISGGTLLRDVVLLQKVARDSGVSAPILEGITSSNRAQAAWAFERVQELVAHVKTPRIALLGLVYKAGTNTLRRSAAVSLAKQLLKEGFVVQAFDPVVKELPLALAAAHLCHSLDEALEGADAAVIATGWPEFRELSAVQLARLMRQAQVVDEAALLPHLAHESAVTYVRPGLPSPSLRRRLEAVACGSVEG